MSYKYEDREITTTKGVRVIICDNCNKELEVVDEPPMYIPEWQDFISVRLKGEVYHFCNHICLLGWMNGNV